MTQIRSTPHLDYDAALTIAADKRHGIWAFDIRIKGSRARWTCGQMPVTTSAHGLLCIGLIAGLRSIQKKQILELLDEEQRPVTSKLRIQVHTRDETFGDAIQGLISRNTEAPAMRAGRNLLRPLAQQLARFAVSFADGRDNNRILALRGWARGILDPAIQDIFAPAGVTQLAPYDFQDVVIGPAPEAAIQRQPQKETRPHHTAPLTPAYY